MANIARDPALATIWATPADQYASSVVSYPSRPKYHLPALSPWPMPGRLNHQLTNAKWPTHPTAVIAARIGATCRPTQPLVRSHSSGANLTVV
ncbi:hypothetical protein SLS64_005945 [Diaporthe eres]